MNHGTAHQRRLANVSAKPRYEALIPQLYLSGPSLQEELTESEMKTEIDHTCFYLQLHSVKWQPQG